MKLFTSIPPRKDGTVIVRLDETAYTFKGTPLGCEVEDEDHAELLQARGFLTQEDFEAEQHFQQQAAKRAARLQALEARAPGAMGDDDDDDLADGGTGQPLEAGAPPSGRVRRASKSAVVKS